MPADTAARFLAAGLPIEERPIARLRSAEAELTAIEFTDGSRLERDVLFAQPPMEVHVDGERRRRVAVP